MHDPDCIFCKIVRGEIPADVVYEDEDVLAFKDISPQAKIHTLIIPKVHIASLNELEDEHIALGGKLLKTAAKVAKLHGIDESGYRTVINTNADSGQVVFHVHVHVMGGQPLRKMG